MAPIHRITPAQRHDRHRPAIQRVLIGVDFSTGSLSAARWAAHHLAPEAELVLAHIIPVPRAPTYLGGVELSGGTGTDGTASAKRAGLAALSESLGAVRCAIEVRSGDPAERLAELAEEHEVDLVVVGRTGERGRAGRELGRSLERVLRRSARPVLVAGGQLGAPPQRVLAAVDDGHAATILLCWASRLARCGAREQPGSVAALHVIDERLSASGARAPSRTAAAWLRARVVECALDPSATHTAIAEGDPRHELLAAAGAFGSDLVIVGRQGGHAGAAAAIGGVARAALRPAARSVLVVPTGTGPALVRSPVARIDRQRERLTLLSFPRG